MFFSSWFWGFGSYLVTAGSDLVQKNRRFESCEWAGLVPLLLQPRAEHLSSFSTMHGTEETSSSVIGTLRFRVLLIFLSLASGHKADA